MDSTAASALIITLRNGATCILRDGALTSGDTTVPLSQLVFATLVADVSVPVAPGMPPAPAVALQLANGASYFLTPLEQADATRLLQAIHTARPDLAQPSPATPPPYGPGYGAGPGYGPPPGYNPGPGYPPSYGAPVYPGYPPQSSAPDSDRGFGVLAHLSGFFLPVILPLILWLALRTSHPYASKQAKQAFVFQLCVWGLGIVLIGVSYGYSMYSLFSFMSSLPTNPTTAPSFPIGWFIGFFVTEGIAILWSLTNLVASVIASMQVAQGKPFHYPLLGRL